MFSQLNSVKVSKGPDVEPKIMKIPIPEQVQPIISTIVTRSSSMDIYGIPISDQGIEKLKNMLKKVNLTLATNFQTAFGEESAEVVIVKGHTGILKIKLEQYRTGYDEPADTIIIQPVAKKFGFTSTGELADPDIPKQNFSTAVAVVTAWANGKFTGGKHRNTYKKKRHSRKTKRRNI
jgi:hypothetical protein